MYNKENFAVGKVASKEKHRYNINSIYCHPKYTVATDGHMLMIVTAPKVDLQEMPVPTNGELTDKFEPFILDLEDAKKIEKSIPKKSCIPILSNAAVLKSGNGNAEFFTTNLQSQNITVSKKIEGEYAQFGKVFPKGKPIAKIGMDAKLLKQLCEALIEANGSKNGSECRVVIEIRNNEGPIVIRSNNADTGQKITSIIMPMRIK